MNYRRVLSAGATYFALVFGAGMAMGIVRVGLLVARIGERYAELVEAPLMLGVIYFAAGWVVKKFEVPAAAGARLGMGLTGLAILLGFEFTLVLGMRGLTFGEYVASRDPVAGMVYVAMLVVYGVVMPLVVRR